MSESERAGDKGGDEQSKGSYAGIKAISSFDDMGLKDDLLRGIYAYGMLAPAI